MEHTRPGMMAFSVYDGTVRPDATRTCIGLRDEEVMRAMYQIGRSIGLVSPFDIAARRDAAIAGICARPKRRRAEHDHLRLAFSGSAGVFLAPEDVDNAGNGPDAYRF